MLPRNHNTRKFTFPKCQYVSLIITGHLLERKLALTLVRRPKGCAVILRMSKQQ